MPMNIKPYNEKLVQLTQLLNDGQYHDGNILSQTLGITCSTIRKMIEKLKQYGVAIDSSQNNRYLLSEPLILLDPASIQKSLHYDVELTVLESISSTNDYFKLSEATPHTILCCLTEQQTQGRGRLQRVWHSPFGKNIYLSCYYPFQKDIRALAGLSLVISLAVLATLRALGFNDGMVKWPNDIFYQGKKLAGILMDVQTQPQGFSMVTIGIGLNVNMTARDELAIDQSWTSLREESGASLDRNYVVALLLQHLLDYVHRFAQEGFSVFSEEWAASDSLLHQTVTLDYMSHHISGEAVGINSKGHLLIRFPDESVQAFSSGEVVLLKK